MTTNEDELKILPKRRLGTGHWDKKLIENMTMLSVANNYEEASQEWIATGRVWWRGLNEIPEWVIDSGHNGYCLCGHRIEYHFEIENQENGIREVVGSDHISTYMIIKQIAKSQNRNIEDISEEEILEWLSSSVESMKKTAWWEINGDSFKKMFDEVKEFDVRINVREKNIRYDYLQNKYIADYTLRKASSGNILNPSEYRMASIVWRWNHPDNPKNQRDTRGYPTEKLMGDLIQFYYSSMIWRQEIEEEDRKIFSLNYVKERTSETVLNNFKEMCLYYGIIDFNIGDYPDHYRSVLSDCKTLLGSNQQLNDELKERLFSIIRENAMTEKQYQFILRLNYNDSLLEEQFGEFWRQISKRKASSLIDDLLKQQTEENKRGGA